MKLGTNDIGSVYLGTNAVQKVYLGTNEVWSSYAYLLDDYPNAAAAYSLRLLRSAYTGSAIRVRRASDNTEQDIGFVDNELDTSTLTSFCSGTNGFVKTWYDQSGNGNDATQTTAANQPQIVSSGALILSGDKPTLESTTFTFFNTPPIELAQSIFTSIDRIGNICVLDGLNGSDPQVLRYISATAFFAEGYTLLNGYINSIASFNETTTSNTVFSITGKLLVSSIGTPNTINIGRIYTRNSNGSKMQELILYGNNQSANRTQIETNIAQFYNISLSS